MNFLIPDKEPKLTESEIMKALECCSTATCISNKCPYEKMHDIPMCTTKLTEDALDLITDKNDSIEMYRRNIALLDEQILAKDKEIAEKDSEIEELAYKLECLLCTVTGSKLSKCTYDLKTMESYANDYVQECCEEAQSEAIKEFAERVKEDMCKKCLDKFLEKEGEQK